MTNLNQLLDQTNSNLLALDNKIVELQKQLKDLEQESKVSHQVQEAQQNLTKKWTEQLKSISSLMRDSASVFQNLEAPESMLEDVMEALEEVKENFEDYKTSSRYLDAHTAEMEDIQANSNQEVLEPLYNEILIDAPMPESGNNEYNLSVAHVKELINHLPKKDLKRLSVISDIGNLSSLKSISQALSDKGVTRASLEQMMVVMGINNSPLELLNS